MVLLQDLVNEENTSNAFAFFEKLGAKFFTKLLVDLLSVFILVRFIYYPTYKSRENFFTFFIFNILIFLIAFTLKQAEMSPGAGFGMFAVFSLLRFRTEGISPKDMTYLFLIIAMGLITAMSKGSWTDIAFINGFIIVFTYALESSIFMKKEISQNIQYENIEMIKPELRAELLADLETRMGIKINRISIGRIDFLKDTAMIRVFYYIQK